MSNDQQNYTEVDCVRDTLVHIRQFQDNLTLALNDLIEEMKDHDQSKFTEEELKAFTKVTPKLRKLEYGSVEYKDNLKLLNDALKHHYKSNRHHPEHFKEGINGMTLMDLVAMICDWWAATRRHETGDIRKSIRINRDRFGYGEDLEQIFLNTIERLETQSKRTNHH